MGTNAYAQKHEGMDFKTHNQRYEGYRFKINYPVLDIGGFNGTFLECVGVSKATIIDMTDKENPKYDYIKADISKKLPTIKKKFKTIFATEILEHLRNPFYLMAQVFDLLDDDGTCYISVPYTRLGTMEHSEGEWDLGHVSRWKLKEIIDQMNKLGFKTKVLQTRKRFKGIGFWLPHCWIVLALKKKS